MVIGTRSFVTSSDDHVPALHVLGSRSTLALLPSVCSVEKLTFRNPLAPAFFPVLVFPSER